MSTRYSPIELRNYITGRGTKNQTLALPGGVEPPHDGVKVRCRSTWLREYCFILAVIEMPPTHCIVGTCLVTMWACYFNSHFS